MTIANLVTIADPAPPTTRVVVSRSASIDRAQGAPPFPGAYREQIAVAQQGGLLAHVDAIVSALAG